jgi:hypothetical protein
MYRFLFQNLSLVPLSRQMAPSFSRSLLSPPSTQVTDNYHAFLIVLPKPQDGWDVAVNEHP